MFDSFFGRCDARPKTVARASTDKTTHLQHVDLDFLMLTMMYRYVLHTVEMEVCHLTVESGFHQSRVEWTAFEFVFVQRRSWIPVNVRIRGINALIGDHVLIMEVWMIGLD
jgi:hypothetical protein